MTTALSDRDYQALARFRHALRVFQRFSEEAARAEHITPAQHQLLLAVHGHAGATPPVVADLADALQLRHHSVVELIDRADTAGLVRRSADPGDLRRQNIRLTGAGREVLERLSRVHRDELRRFRSEMVDLLRELD
jgi:DNA-binding MarR family transcriptional regulator